MSVLAQTGDLSPVARARLLRSRGRIGEALAALREAVSAEPGNAEAHHQLGNLLKGMGAHAEAVQVLAEAARLDPRQAAIWLNLGVSCLELGRLPQAEDCFRQAIALEPGRPEAHNILGHVLLAQGRCAAAARALDRALELRPGYSAAHDNMGRVLKAQGRAAEARVHHLLAMGDQPQPATHSNLLFTLNLIPGLDPAAVAAEHRRWARLHAPGGGEDSGGGGWDLSAGRRLRVGYVSPDLVRHAVSHFFEPVLRRHHRAGFDVVCYSDAPAPDLVTERLRPLAGAWRDTSRMGDAELEALVRRDRVDILVDLAGHTARNRLAVFARRPAPVQATWLGYPNTTGLSAIDYRLTDPVCDPPGETESWHSERLWRLPRTFLCFRPPGDSPPVGPLPALAAGGRVTFGCFNNFAKVSGDTVRSWSRLLRRVPGSRIFLKSRGLGDPATATAVRRAFEGQGVGGERVELNGEELSVPAHLGLYGGVDIALDTSPYNGTTTTCESLWMGVPVVTLAGRVHASRVGASLLGSVGLEGCVAASEEDYARAAAALASDLSGLSALRAALRGRMAASALCDEEAFARDLETAYRAMWSARCGLP
jgi:predicted O-linked N-acetylglucosamine transferase (SPINDLY family)